MTGWQRNGVRVGSDELVAALLPGGEATAVDGVSGGDPKPAMLGTRERLELPA
jgi:hypothetical protein